MNSRRSWIILIAAVFAYFIAVTQRTTFGIAGVEATDRFEVTAAAVSSVAVIQVAVYAILQIPVGLLVDRFGPPALIVSGALLMAAGQLLLAFSPSLAPAIVARVLVGAGDAFTFVSVIRLLPFWFSGRILPPLSQWIGMVGQLGQIMSAIPFALLLHAAGWEASFLVAAAVSMFAAVVAVIVVRTGDPPPATGSIVVTGVLPRLAAAARRPGTQLGFWVHLVAGTPVIAISVMWGYPFLTAGLGYSVGLAALMMSLLVVGQFIAGPIIGYVIARYPLRRSTLVITLMVALYLITLAMVLWPHAPPIWLVAVFLLGLGTAGPGSLVGLDVARTFNPSHALGSATGIANVGGFTGAFISMFLVGVALDAINSARIGAGGESDLYSFDSFRIALLIPFVLSALGIIGLLIARRRTRRLMFAEEGIEVAPFWVALMRRRRGTAP